MGPMNTTGLQKGDYMGFHVSLGESILVAVESSTQSSAFSSKGLKEAQDVQTC